jgi:hypothetical protein
MDGCRHESCEGNRLSWDAGRARYVLTVSHQKSSGARGARAYTMELPLVLSNALDQHLKWGRPLILRDRADHGWLFVNSKLGRPYTPGNLCKNFQNFMRIIGMRHITPALVTFALIITCTLIIATLDVLCVYVHDMKF